MILTRMYVFSSFFCKKSHIICDFFFYIKNNAYIYNMKKLPLNTQYFVIDKKYIPLENGSGLCCDNCGKLIANIATVKNSNNDTFYIGFDCLESLLINNSLLSNSDIYEYEKIKKMIPKILRFSKQLKEIINMNNGLDGLIFERPTDSWFISSGWITYYLVKNNQKPYNTNVKIKDMDFDFLILTLKTIFNKLNITIK